MFSDLLYFLAKCVERIELMGKKLRWERYRGVKVGKSRAGSMERPAVF
jgi:hypothetical protein